MPVMIPSAAATSYTLRAIGPPVSKLSASGMIPDRLSNPWVGLSAAMPFDVAGPRIDPPVSLPSAQGTSPQASATAAPPDEPPQVLVKP